MVTLSVLYPNRDGATFDMEYYLTSHIPMLQRELGGALKGCTVQQGLSGRDPGTTAELAVLCELRFDSVEAYREAMAPIGDKLRDDVSNYSSEAPIVQLSEVIVAA
jgi:uncharacterized protein (TIGR02118 family)